MSAGRASAPRLAVLASSNRGKLRELGALLEPVGLRLRPQSACGIDPVAETGATFLANALLKARHAARLSGCPALADDSGLEVDALGGRPGVHSARYAGEGASDAANIDKLLGELQGVADEQRGARYRCVIVYVRDADDPAPLVAEGAWEGRIAAAPRGTGGFGYDPVFVPLPGTSTAAELPAAQKNAASHRGQACRALLSGLAAMPAPAGLRSAAMQRGRLYVIAAPSGAGKTSLVRALLERRPQLHVSVSHTTRPRRPSEQAGREYYFVTVPEFEAAIAAGQFLEWARVFDNLYGTARAPVEEQLARGRSVVLEIDWQGARQVRRALPECVGIFVLPPSRAALAERLRGRGTDAPEVVERRLRDAVGDMSHYDEFDYVVVNEDFERALQDLTHIVDGDGAGLAAGRAGLAPLLSELLPR